MRVLVTSDTHAPRRELPLWLVRLAGAADLIIHAGDLCDAEVYRVLSDLAPLYAVCGNNDFRLALPEQLTLRLGDVSIGVAHGHLGPGRTTEERALRTFAPAPDVVIYGHSHVPVLRHEAGMLVLNPGSPTLPRAGAASAALLELSAGRASARMVGPQEH